MRERCGAPLAATRAPDAGPPVLLPANAVFELRRLAWRRAGIERSGESIREGLEELERLAPIFRQGLARNSRQGFEANNMFEVVSLIARCALAREESRGCHFRSDFPLKNPEFQKHSLARSGAEVTFV
jgi:L-aspartate oxidase